MDKNTKTNLYKNGLDENVNAAVTSNSFYTYSKLQKKSKRISAKAIALYSGIAVLLLASVISFAFSIKDAFFSDKENHTDSINNIETIKAVYQKNDLIKVEKITNELAGLYEIPTGVKIIEIDAEHPLLKGLRIGDIVVQVSGKSVNSISDMDNIISTLSEESLVTFTIFRNGVYKTITPFEEQY